MLTIMSLEGPFLPVIGAFSVYHVYYDMLRGGGEWPFDIWFKGPLQILGG